MPGNYLMFRRLATPTRVQLTNGQVFHAKYQRVARNVLSERVRVRRTYVRKTGAQRQQK